MTLNCINCENKFTVERLLESAEYSWPEWSTVWSTCGSCGTGVHVRVTDGLVQTLKVLGQGPDWEPIESAEAPGISTRIDESFLHVWLGGRHFEISARK